MEITIVPPHRKVSRPVTLEDRERVLETEKAMREWMLSKYSCVGLAHPQVDDQDPLAFFITLQEPMKIICNPKIVVYSSVKTQSKEGCMTYPNTEHVWHDRHVAITVEYEIFKGKKLIKKRKQINGFLAIVYQHEIDHLNAKYCYDKTGPVGPVGPAGSTEPLPRHHEPTDFEEGYQPHVMCLIGAMCEKCGRNLKQKIK